jgi:hypothetical protein
LLSERSLAVQITHCGDEIGDGLFMQTPAQMFADESLFKLANGYMYDTLDRLAAQC